MKKLLILASMLWSLGANAQFTPGQILTAAELNSQFALYAPLAGATFTGGVSGTTFTGAFSGSLNGSVGAVTPSTGSFTNLTATGTVTLPSIALSGLATQAANTIVANATASSASPTAIAVPSCSTSSSALNWTTSGGASALTCNTAVNAATLGGATFASPGAIGSGTASTGSFTSLVASGTVSGTGFVNLLSPYALLASPTFTGTPAAPTAAAGTNTTQIATTANVVANFATPPVAGYGSTTPEPVAATTLSSTGNFTPSQTNGIVGTTTNNNANAGSVGEYVQNSTGGTSLTTATNSNSTSISLTAGDWDVWGAISFVATGATGLTNLVSGINTTSVTLPSPPLYLQSNATVAATSNNTFALVPQRITLTTFATVYVVSQATFSAGTVTTTGFIAARRRR